MDLAEADVGPEGAGAARAVGLPPGVRGTAEGVKVKGGGRGVARDVEVQVLQQSDARCLRRRARGLAPINGDISLGETALGL